MAVRLPSVVERHFSLMLSVSSVLVEKTEASKFAQA